MKYLKHLNIIFFISVFEMDVAPSSSSAANSTNVLISEEQKNNSKIRFTLFLFLFYIISCTKYIIFFTLIYLILFLNFFIIIFSLIGLTVTEFVFLFF